MAKPLSKNSLLNSNTWTNFWQITVLEYTVFRTHNWQSELVGVWSEGFSTAALQWPNARTVIEEIPPNQTERWFK